MKHSRAIRESPLRDGGVHNCYALMNASLYLRGMEQIILPRHSSYIGTLIDDLVTKGTNEPYRMMTSRSEYRLLLRQDNADKRLTELGYRVGLVTEERYRRYLEKREAVERELKRLESTVLPPSEKVLAYLASLGSAAPKSGFICRHKIAFAAY